MIIMCDIDNCLNDLTERTLALYNHRTGKNIQINDLVAYDFFDCLSEEDAAELHKLFKEKSLWDSLRPIQGSQKGLKKLIQLGHEVYLATATLPETFPWKIAWLQKYFPFFNPDNVIRINNKGLLKCDIMIDDHIDNLTSNLCERIIIDAQWNRSSSKDFAYDIKRAYSWKDIIDIVIDIERSEKEWQAR